MRKPLFWVCLMGLIWVGLPCAGAEKSPSNQKVGQDVDQITSGPRYKWLREGTSDGNDPLGKFGTGEGQVPRGPRRFEDKNGCDFEPNLGDDRDDPLPEGEGCASGSPGALPDDASDGCGCDPSMGDCGCDPSIGNCGFAPDLSNCGCSPTIGNCGGCGAIGSALPLLGYGVGAMILGLLLFLVVRAILNRDTPVEDTAIAPIDDLERPEDARASQISAAHPSMMLHRAEASAAAGDFRTAIGWAYLCGISLLSRGGFVDLSDSTTNQTILESTRYRNGPLAPVGVLLGHFEDLFFGDLPADANRWEACRVVVTRDFSPIWEEVSNES